MHCNRKLLIFWHFLPKLIELELLVHCKVYVPFLPNCNGFIDLLEIYCMAYPDTNILVILLYKPIISIPLLAAQLFFIDDTFVNISHW